MPLPLPHPGAFEAPVRPRRARLAGVALTLAASTLVGVPDGAGAQLPSPVPAAWDRLVAGWRADAEAAGIVGASLALVHEGRLERLETHGAADLGASRPVDEHTIYHWASITKTFTAVAVLQLRDRGLLSLDDPVVRYVPELREVHNPFGSMEAVTLRHLLSHSAGFRGGTWPWNAGEAWEPYEPTEWSQLVAMMPYTRVLFQPGSRYAYSNPGIIFLGRVIEAVTGDAYEAYVEKNIFRPLGMASAYFDATPWHLLHRRSDHYFVRDGVPHAGGADFNTGITVSNGGLNASVPDLARWLAFLMGTPPGGVDGDAILARSTLEEMWRPVVPIGTSAIGPESMGLSFFLYDHGGRGLVGHTGTQKAFYSFFILDPAAKVAAVAVFNTVGAEGAPPQTDALRLTTRERVVKDVFPHFRDPR